MCSLIHWLVLASLLMPAFGTIIWNDCRKNVPTALEEEYSGLNLTSLPATLYCGQMEVPMDYAKPIGPTNNITIGLAMYRPREPKGLLFFCPGGTDPGAVAAWQISLNLISEFTPYFKGLLDYDIMAMDIRGTWSSNALNVSLDTVASLLASYPSNEQEYVEFQEASATMFQSWTNHSSPPGIVEHVGTREVVQDYEAIRSALGYEEVHFLGASTGSYRATQYAATYPDRVGHFALDAVVPHGMDILDQVKYDIIAINRELLRADAFCQKNVSCPFHHEGKGSVPKAWSDVLVAAQNGTLSACGNVATCNETLTPFDVQSALASLLGGQPDFLQLIERLVQALEGDGAAFVANSPLTIDETWGIPLFCNDYAITNGTWSDYQQIIQAAKEVDTNHIYQSEWLLIRAACSAWPYVASVDKPLELNATMLLVTADFDGSEPTEKTTFAWSQTPHSGLVVRHGDDHVSFDLPKRASTQITKAFLRSGCLPPPINETFVTVYEPGMTRQKVADPYEVPTGFQAGDVDSA